MVQVALIPSYNEFERDNMVTIPSESFYFRITGNVALNLKESAKKSQSGGWPLSHAFIPLLKLNRES